MSTRNMLLAALFFFCLPFGLFSDDGVADEEIEFSHLDIQLSGLQITVSSLQSYISWFQPFSDSILLQKNSIYPIGINKRAESGSLSERSLDSSVLESLLHLGFYSAAWITSLSAPVNDYSLSLYEENQSSQDW